MEAETKVERPRRAIGRVEVDVVTGDAAVARILAGVAERRPSMVSFCNAHTVNLAARSEALVAALAPSMVLNDGIGVDLASRLLHGAQFPENLNGTDFTPRLLRSAPAPLRVYLLGSAPGVAEIAAARLGSAFPQHRFVGTHHGFFTAADEERVAAAIAAAEPDLILVGMGQPRQEIWAAANFRRFAAVTMCIGAFLDFSAGNVARAPDWLRRMRAEWVYRLAQEPRRLAGRYLVGNGLFLMRTLSQALARR
jgi:N-acetylglucosaminyldiphosphoundecaprenol N-acetyl-beta-D-mannosaminyltransferase/alpha-1,3-mannosyltransferase